MGECSRCGAAVEPDAAWCGECGLALKATSGLRTPEALEAAAREQRWVEEHEGAAAWARPAARPDPPPAPGPQPRTTWALPGRPRYKPIVLRAHILRWWLVAGILVNAAVTVLSAIHLSILDSDGFAGSDAVVASDERLAIGGAALLATFLVSTILWLLWFHRAYRNVESFGSVAMRFGSGWAVGAWFVPILNWFRPKQIANDIWRGTEPERARDGAWSEPPVAPLVHWWWAAWLVANLLGNLSFRLINDARTLDAERTAVTVDIAAGISFVLAGVLALRFVRAVTEREAARAAALHGAEADAERVRTAREGRGRRRVATVAVTLVGAAALVVSVAVAAGSLSDSDRDASGEVTERSAVSVFELRRGDCLNGLDEATVIRAVEVVPCERAHQAEVLSGVRMQDGEFPGMRAVGSEAERLCGARLVAAAPPRRNGRLPYFLHPTRQSWALGDRLITCIVTFDVPMRGAVSDRRRP